MLLIYSCGNTESKGQSSPLKTTTANSTRVGSTYERIAQTPESGRTLESLDIDITVEGGPTGTYYLMGVFTETYFLADSTAGVNGKLNFKNDNSVNPGMYYCYFPDQRTSFQILIDQDQQFTMKTRVNDLINSMEVSGCIDNELLYQSMKYDQETKSGFVAISEGFKTHQPVSAEHDKLIIDHKKLLDDKNAYLKTLFRQAPTSLFTSFKESGQNPILQYEFNENGSLAGSYLYELRTQYWDNLNFNDERLLNTPVVSNKLDKHFGDFMPQKPDSIIRYASLLCDQALVNREYFKYIANWITLKFEPTKTTLMDAEAVFVHMIQNYFTDERAFWQDSVQTYGLQLRAHEMSGSLIGGKAPEIKAKGPDGKFYSIYDIKSDYIIVYMWNPDCEHCAEQTPKLVEFYKEWNPKGVEVYSIVVNTEEAKWRAAIKRYGMPWINIFDPTNRAIYGKYFVDNTPELYLINKERIIIGKNLKVYQIEQVIEQDKNNRG